jgi:hypothetical protein
MRSGRHALAKDFNQTNGGIVIDTGLMTEVNADKENWTATGVGVLVRMLARDGIPAPFGDSSTVGIGGISTIRRQGIINIAAGY